jgi:hypothetical protein
MSCVRAASPRLTFLDDQPSTSPASLRRPASTIPDSRGVASRSAADGPGTVVFTDPTAGTLTSLRDLVLPVRRLPTDGAEAWADVQRRGYEGLVAKDEAAPYRGPSGTWLKVKVPARGQVPDRVGLGDGVRGLLVGEVDDEQLRLPRDGGVRRGCPAPSAR